MFGLQYKLKCPYCGKFFTADHGITSYFKIKGYGDTEYVKEYCYNCGEEYFRRCCNSNAMNMKLKGLTYYEAMLELEKQDNEKNKKFIGIFYKEVPEQRLKEQEERRIENCNEVYSLKDEELYINIKDVDKNDLIHSSVVCW